MRFEDDLIMLFGVASLGKLAENLAFHLHLVACLCVRERERE